MGSVVAERFLLLASQPVPESFGLTHIDYARPLPRNLTVTETGAIHLEHGSHDLVTAAQISQWALHTADSEWQLTAESVSMLNSSLITACLHGYIEPDLLFVNPRQFETLRQHLCWLGWKISARLQITPFRSQNRV